MLFIDADITSAEIAFSTRTKVIVLGPVTHYHRL